jgi:ankyrin repeat protein
MDDINVDAVLKLLGLRTFESETNHVIDIHREELISKLMNIILHSLGALRLLIIEEEKIIFSNKISNSSNSTEKLRKISMHSKNQLQRNIFSEAVKTFTEAIISGTDYEEHEPIKDLVESFPWVHTLTTNKWHILNWSIMTEGIITNNEHRDFDIKAVSKLIENFPNCINEMDKQGQHYMAYAIKTNCIPLVEMLINQNKNCTKFKDGTGKLPLHHCAYHSNSVDLLYCIVDKMSKPLSNMVSTYIDDDGNLPIHLASIGTSCVDVLKEILFASPDSVRIINKNGQLPFHLACSGNDVNKLKILLAAYPQAINIPINNNNSNDLYPLQQAAFSTKSIDVIKFLYEVYPEGIIKPNKTGRIALHYAVVKCNEPVIIEFLIEKYKNGAQTFDLNKRLPLHVLIARCEYMDKNRIEVLKILLNAYPHGVTMRG